MLKGINEYKAAIFDLDGVLIDSEPLWQQAEVEVLSRMRVPLTPEMCFQTVGMKIDDVVAYWYERYPWPAPNIKEVAEDVVERMLELIDERGRPMPGALSVLRMFNLHEIPVGIATSSRKLLAHASIDKLGIAGYIRAISSAEEQTHGKPHPVVYLEAARMLNAAPETCLVFEDSINGVISAKAARMSVIAIPYPHWRDDPRFVLADKVVNSLEKVNTNLLKSMRANGS